MTVTQIRASDLTIGMVVSLPRFTERLTVVGVRLAPIVVAPDTEPRLLVDFEEDRRLNGPFPVEATLSLHRDETVLVITDDAPNVTDADRIAFTLKRIDHWTSNLTAHRDQLSTEDTAKRGALAAQIADLHDIAQYLNGTEDGYIASLKPPKGA
jgi:hypothetical protein